MDVDDITETTPQKRPYQKKLDLNSNKEARESLCRVTRMYYNGKICDTAYRNLVYGLSKLLEYDKYALESEMEKRLDALEQAINGAGNTAIDSKDIDNPYAESLKKRLAETEQVKSNIEQRLLEAEKEVKTLRAELSFYAEAAID